MKEENQSFKDEVFLNSKENLLTDKYLAKGDTTTFTYEKPAVQVDLAAKNLNEPRMMTVKQIRDLFYSLMNTSTAQQRITDSEASINKLFDKTALLTYEDQDLSNRLNQNFDSLTKSIGEVQSFAKKMEADHDKRFADLFSRIQMNLENIRKLNKHQEENKHF